MTNIDNLNNFVSGESNWLKEAQERRKNRAWLRHSQKIAAKVLSALRNGDKKMTQKELANRIGVSPQQVNKIVKGRENLTLETITKLEQALGISLIFEEPQAGYVYKIVEVNAGSETTEWNISSSKKEISRTPMEYQPVKEGYTTVSEGEVKYG